MGRRICWVAFGYITEEKCSKICKAMDNRTAGMNALPMGVTKTRWTQKRCRECKYHKYESGKK